MPGESQQPCRRKQWPVVYVSGRHVRAVRDGMANTPAVDRDLVLVCRGTGWLSLFVVCAIAADVEPEVPGQGQESLQGRPVEFGCVLGGV
jgi:hypothetical protein